MSKRVAPDSRSASPTGSGSAPAPLLTRRGRGGGASPRLVLPLIGIFGGLLLLVLIAASVSGLTRALVLAVLTPLLVLTTLLLWRSARASVTASYVRRATIAAMRARGVAGVLAIAPADATPEGRAATQGGYGDAAWEGWAERLAWATAPRLATVSPADAATARGQQALGLLHDLLGEARPAAGAALALPRRTTLALLDTNDDVHIWDVSALLERARAGTPGAGATDATDATTEAAQLALVDLETYVLDIVVRAGHAEMQPRPN